MKLLMGRVAAWLIAVSLVLAAVAGFGAMAPVGAQDDTEPIVVELLEVNDSGVTGTATLTAVDGATEVVLQLEGVLDGNVVHIHAGTCESYEPDPLAPAGDIVLSPTGEEGESTTTIPVPLADWLALETIIHVHAGEREIEDILVCGDVVAPEMEEEAEAEATETPAVGGVNGVSDTGIGPSDLDDRGGLVLMLGGVAALLLAAGAMMRRRGQGGGRAHTA